MNKYQGSHMQEKDVDCRPGVKRRGIRFEYKCDNTERNLLSDMQKEGADSKVKWKKREVLLNENKHNFSVKSDNNTENKQSSHMQGKDLEGWQELMMVVPLHEYKYSPTDNNAHKEHSSHMRDRSLEYKPEQLGEVTLHEVDTSDIDSSVSATFGKKHKRKVIKLKNLQLNMRCEWQDCNYCTTNLNHFVQHVSFHIPHLEVKETNDQEGVYACLWESCGFQCADPKEIIRHVNFHSFHTKIKCIGSHILAQSRQPACTYVDVGKNLVPDLPHAFVCHWDDCERTFNNAQMFFHHVQTHVYHNPRGHKVAGGVPCGWRGCKLVLQSVYKLEEHARRHTQEKPVGCPTCGGLFANKVKFLDHCMRQVPQGLQKYECLHCGKHSASKRLLADHISHHMYNHQCSFCDMTFTRPSDLVAHIRNRHLDAKPFKCHTCDYAARIRYDMDRHLATHSSDALYCCKEEGCHFSFRSAYGLLGHCRRYHPRDDKPTYRCHICDAYFQQGSLLSVHLMNEHNICRPPGHSRFRYKLQHGYFQLQRAQPVQSQASSAQPLRGASRYNLRRLSDRSFEITASEDGKGPRNKEGKRAGFSSASRN